MQELLPYIMIGGLVAVYVLSYLLNKKTPIPEACLTDEEQAACAACNNFSCSHHGGEQ